MKKLLAFLRRDIQEQMSYRALFLRDIFGTFFSCLTFFFLSRIIVKGDVPSLSPYGGDYFSFALVGIAFATLEGWALSSFTTTVSSAQQTGTIEALLATRTPVPLILVGSSLYPLLRGIVDIALYLIVGILVLGVRLPQANIPAAIAVLLLSLLVFAGVGLLSAAFTMVFKKGDPFTFLLNMLSAVVSGVVYPVAILPAFLRQISVFVPLTHSLEAMRRTLLSGAPLSEVGDSITALCVFALVVVPSGIVLFGRAVRRAKREGTLTQF